MTFQELHEKYEEALSRVKELERENARLKKVLQERQIDVDDARGLDGVIGIVVVLIIGAVFFDELEALGKGVILPTAIVFVEI